MLSFGTVFLITSKQFVIKPLGKNITTAFKSLYKSVEKYHNKSQFYPGLTPVG